MKKPWSISTTVRNAERIRNFLIALKEFDGEVWNKEKQIQYQILLIQRKYYGLTNQFFNGLSPKQIEQLNAPEGLTFEQAQDIFHSKNYTDPSMRGRQSFNPLKKMGLVSLVDKKIHISSLGNYLLREDYDLGEMFFRSFLKWQLPTPGSNTFPAKEGFCIKPFVATLHLIKRLNANWEKMGKKPKGISKEEFSLFVPTLRDYQKIEEQAQCIIDLRIATEGKKRQEQKKILEKYTRDYVSTLLETKNPAKITTFIKNLKDYGDNTLRYFRLTRYIHIRGAGFYIDLEDRRYVEIDALLKTDDASPKAFGSATDYIEYIADIAQPVLPWETDDKLKKIAYALMADIESLEDNLKAQKIAFPEIQYKKIDTMHADALKKYISEMRIIRRKIQDIFVHFRSQHIENIEEYIDLLENIHTSDKKQSIELERLSTLALNALNDALEINPNYPVGDDNIPTFTAPGNKPDIECFYEKFNAVCEVTMLTSRAQWYSEGQPVMRHMRDFEDKYPDKDVYCLFIAPRLHRDTIETFWMSIKYGYRGNTQKIIPLSITHFIKVLRVLVSLKKQGKKFTHMELLNLYDKVISLTNSSDHSDMWLKQIPKVVDAWKESVLSTA